MGAATEQQTPLEAAGVIQRRHLSFSQLNTYLSCGTKYELSYIEGVEREPQGALLGGIAVHGAVAEGEQLSWWRPEVGEFDPLRPYHQVVEAFHVRFETLVDEAGGETNIRWGGRGGGETKRWWDTYGEFMVRRWVTTRQAWDGLGYIAPADSTEMRVEANLPGVPIPVVGYLDKFLMRRLDPETGEVGGHGIVDWKTGKIGYVDPMQFATYARLVKVVKGIDVTWGSVVFLRAADAERRITPVNFLPLVERMDEMYAGLVEGIEAGRFAPKPSSFCKSCNVRASCWYWQGTGGDDA